MSVYPGGQKLLSLVLSLLTEPISLYCTRTLVKIVLMRSSEIFKFNLLSSVKLYFLKRIYSVHRIVIGPVILVFGSQHTLSGLNKSIKQCILHYTKVPSWNSGQRMRLPIKRFWVRCPGQTKGNTGFFLQENSDSSTEYIVCVSIFCARFIKCLLPLIEIFGIKVQKTVKY